MNRVEHLRHEKVTIANLKSDSMDVDVDMTPLVLWLLNMGIDVDASCQGAPKFVDQTEYDARHYVAFIRMIRTTESLDFVKWLVNDTDIFEDEKVLWSIEFDRSPNDNINRIRLSFPHQDIQRLLELLRIENDKKEFVDMVSSIFDDAEKKVIQEMKEDRRDF